MSGPPRGASGAALVALLLACGVASAQGPVVPRDEPEALPEPGAPQLEPAPPVVPYVDELPDYGPRPEEEGAPAASQPHKPAPLVIKRTPRLKLTYQRFEDHRLGGEGSPYHIGALTFFPLSTWVRLGCTVRFGMEQTDGKPSWFIDLLATAGVQIPEAARGFTPFLDLSVGPGFRYYTSLHNSYAALQWTFGLDAGAEVYLGGRFYLTGAVGWVRPVVRLKEAAGNKASIDVFSDAFIFKLGIGF